MIVWLLLSIFVLFPAILGGILLYTRYVNRKNEAVCKGVVNTDFFSRRYLYVLDTDQRGVLERLSVQSVCDEPRFTFDEATLVITFIQNLTSIRYQLQFAEREGCTYLLVCQIDLFPGRSTIPWLVNPFWVNKVGARPVPYAEFQP